MFRTFPSSGLSEFMLQRANEGISNRIFTDKQSDKLHCLATSVALFGDKRCTVWRMRLLSHGISQHGNEVEFNFRRRFFKRALENPDQCLFDV